MLFGALVGLTVGILTVAVLAAALALSDISDGWLAAGASAASGLGALVGGMTAARKNGEKGLVCGGMAGLVMSFFLYCIGSLLSGGFVPTLQFLPSFAIAVGAAALGGICGVNIRKKNRV